MSDSRRRPADGPTPKVGWAGDFLRAAAELAPDELAAAAILDLLGMAPERGAAPSGLRKASPLEPPLAEAQATAADPQPLPPPRKMAEPARHALEPVRCFSLLTDLRDARAVATPDWVAGETALSLAPAAVERLPAPLLSPLKRRSILSFMLAGSVPDGPPDIERIVRELSLARPVRRWPRRRRRTLRYGVELLIDGAEWMQPYRGDQKDVVACLQRLLPADRLVLTPIQGAPPSPSSPARRALASRLPASTVMALTDFGAGFDYVGEPPAGAERWQAFARATQREGRRFRALAPYRAHRLPRGIAGALACLHWAETTTLGDAQRCLRLATRPPPSDAQDREERDQAVFDLATVISPALRIDATLLRAARQQLLPRLPPESEADLWFSAVVGSRGAAGITLKPRLAARLAGQRLGEGKPVSLDRALDLIESVQATQPDSIRLEEALHRLTLRGRVTPENVDRLLRPALKALAGDAATAQAVAAWVPQLWMRLPEAIRVMPAARQLAFGASIHLNAGAWLAPSSADEALPQGLGWLLPAAPREGQWRVELGLDADEALVVRFDRGGPVTHVSHRIDLADHDPLWIRLQSADESASQLVAVEPGAEFAIAAASDSQPASVRIESIDGGLWTLAAVSPSRGLAPSLLSVRMPSGGSPSLLGVLVADDLAWITARIASDPPAQANEGDLWLCEPLPGGEPIPAQVIGRVREGEPGVRDPGTGHWLLRLARPGVSSAPRVPLDAMARLGPMAGGTSPGEHPVSLFMSYSRRDSRIVESLSHRLRVQPLMDLRLGGDDPIPANIDALIGECQIVLLAVSPSWIESRWTLGEAKLALRSGKTIVPILLGPCRWEETRLEGPSGPIRLGDFQALPRDETGRLRPLSEWQSLEIGLNAVVDELARLARGAPQPASASAVLVHWNGSTLVESTVSARGNGGPVRPSGVSGPLSALLFAHAAEPALAVAPAGQPDLALVPLRALATRALQVAADQWTCLVVGDGATGFDALVHTLRERTSPWRVMIEGDAAVSARIQPEVVVFVGGQAPRAGNVSSGEWISAAQVRLWAPMTTDPNSAHARLPAELRALLQPRSWLHSATSAKPDFEAVAHEIESWRTRSDAATALVPPRAAPVRGKFAALTANARRALVQRMDGAKTLGLFRVPFDGELRLDAVEPSSAWPERPVLLLIHGEGSTTQGSFNGLWTDASERARLHSRFGPAAWAFEFASISQGLLANAVALVGSLPAGARLHILGSGVGGVLGELLCGRRPDGGSPYGDQIAALLFTARLEPNAADLLARLHELLDSKRVVVEHLVRVASPMQGLALHSTGVERIAGLARLMRQLTFEAGQGFIAGQIEALLTDAEISPGLAALAQDSGVIRLVNGGLLNERITSPVPLTVIGAVTEPAGLMGKLGQWSANWLLGTGERNDLYMALESNFGGFPREGGFDFHVEFGSEVDHFRLLTNERTRRIVVDALIDSTGSAIGLQHAGSYEEALRILDAFHPKR